MRPGLGAYSSRALVVLSFEHCLDWQKMTALIWETAHGLDMHMRREVTMEYELALWKRLKGTDRLNMSSWRYA